MKRIEIYKPDKKTGKRTNLAELPEAEAIEWLEFHKKNHSFGKPEKTESVKKVTKEAWTEQVLSAPDENGETTVLETINHPEEFEYVTVVIEEAEKFEVVITDITQELAAEKAAVEAKLVKRQAAITTLKATPVSAATTITLLRARLAALEELILD